MACYNKEDVTVFVKTPLGIVELDYSEYHKLYQAAAIQSDNGELTMPAIPDGYIKKIIAMRQSTDLYINARRMRVDPNNKRLYISLKAFLRTLLIYVEEIGEDANISKIMLLDGDNDYATILTIPIYNKEDTK